MSDHEGLRTDEPPSQLGVSFKLKTYVKNAGARQHLEKSEKPLPGKTSHRFETRESRIVAFKTNTEFQLRKTF